MRTDITFHNIDDLDNVRLHNIKFGKENKPAAIIDGIIHRINEIESCIEGDSACIVGVNQDQFQKLCSLIQVKTLYFYEMRVEDLSPLLGQSNLSRLAIYWNTKLIDLSPIRNLTSLQTLILKHTPKAQDISALSNLINLVALEYSGGNWSTNTAKSLVPITRLTNLSELIISNIRIESDGLRPLALCRSLKNLSVNNNFPTEDYAYLAAHLRNTKCELFAPWVRLHQTIGDKDIMVIGKRKPFLNSGTDRKLMDKYSDEFLKLVLEYSVGVS